MVLPLPIITTGQFRNIIKPVEKCVSLIIPNKRIKYIKNGSLMKSPSFDSCYVCYKTIPYDHNSLVWLDYPAS